MASRKQKRIQLKGSRRDNLCQVCQVDLLALNSAAYCLRKRVCLAHLQALHVDVPGIHGPQRFCHQCGKFEPLELFEGERRSCRTKLISRRKHSAAPTESHNSGNAGSPLLQEQDLTSPHQAPSGSTTAATTAAVQGAAAALTDSPCWFDSDDDLDFDLDPELLDFLQGELASSTAQPVLPQPLPPAAAAVPGLLPQQQQLQQQQQQLQVGSKQELQGYEAAQMVLANNLGFSEYLEAVMQDELQQTLREQQGLLQANCSSSSACSMLPQPQQQPQQQQQALGVMQLAPAGLFGSVLGAQQQQQQQQLAPWMEAFAGLANNNMPPAPVAAAAAAPPAPAPVAVVDQSLATDNSSSSSATLPLELYNQMAQQPSKQQPLSPSAAAASSAQGRQRRHQLLQRVQDLLQEEHMLSVEAAAEAAGVATAATPLSCRTAPVSMPAQAPAVPARMQSGRWLQVPSNTVGMPSLLREQSGSCQLPANITGLSPLQVKSSSTSPVSGNNCLQQQVQQHQQMQNQLQQHKLQHSALLSAQQAHPGSEAAIVARMALLQHQVRHMSAQLGELQSLLGQQQSSRPRSMLAAGPAPYISIGFSRCMGL